MDRAVAALGLSQIVGYGSVFYAFPLLAPAMADTFALSEPVLFATFSAGLLAGGLLAPVAGRMMDRHGAPWLMVRGSAAVAVLFALLAAAPSVPALLTAIVALQLVSVAVLYDAAFASLALIRGAGARRAITRLTLIAGFASTIFWPLTGSLVEAIGWRAACAGYGALNLILALPLHLWLARQPAATETAPDPAPDAAAPPSAATTPLPADQAPDLAPNLAAGAFRAVAASFALSATLIAAFAVHMVPVLAGAGLGEGAKFAAMLMGPAQVAIRLVDALFWGRLHPLSVAVISALALPVAVGVLLAGALLPGLPIWLAGPLFACVFGFGQGLASIVRGSVPLALFGRAGYGARLGRLAMLRTFTTAGGPFLFSALLAALGAPATLALFLALGLVAAAPLVVLRARLGRAGLLAPLR